MTITNSNLLSLDWLLPVLNAELASIQTLITNGEKDNGFQLAPESWQQAAKQYWQLHGALSVANLPQFAHVASVLSVTSRYLSQGSMSDESMTLLVQLLKVTHSSLHHQLKQHITVGTYQPSLLAQSCEYLYERLPEQFQQLVPFVHDERGSTHPHQPDAQIDDAMGVMGEDDASNAHDQQGLLSFIHLPENYQLIQLNETQQQQLHLAWRYQLNSLLKANSNDSQALKQLDKFSNYLWRSAQIISLAKAWYLGQVWFNDLAHNSLPKPRQYVHVLSQFDGLVEQTLTLTEQIPADVQLKVNKLLAQLFIQLNILPHKSEQTDKLINGLQGVGTDEQQLFKDILQRLEQLIFSLDAPETVLTEMQSIKKQLSHRGWILYVNYIDQVLQDLQMVTAEPDMLGNLQWQIERQMQELYGAIFNTQQTIEEKIGESAYSSPYHHDHQAMHGQSLSSESVDERQALRQVRIDIETVKKDFKSYLRHQDSRELPKAEQLMDIEQNLSALALNDVSATVNQLGELFEALRQSNLQQLDWQLRDAVAESIAEFELFLDYLAGQIFDDVRLQKTEQKIKRSLALLQQQLAEPNNIHVENPDKIAQPAQVRYDDSGEIQSDDTQSADMTQPTDNGNTGNDTSVNIDDDNVNLTDDDVFMSEPVLSSDDAGVSASGWQLTTEFIKAQDTLKPDNFDMDEEFREIFVEEAGEVLESMEELLPRWQQDPTDLETLKEIRRGFHTLKGSGRMVGAYNVGEMAWGVENMLNRVLDKTLPVSNDLVEFITETQAQLPILVDNFAQGQPPSIDPAVTVVKAHNLLAQQPINTGLVRQETVRQETIKDVQTEPSAQQPVDVIDDADTDVPVMADVSGTISGESQPNAKLPEVIEAFLTNMNLPADDDGTDTDIKEIFIEEAYEVLDTIAPEFESWAADTTDLKALTEVRRGFHTLKGSGRMVGANHSGELAWHIENMLNRVLDHSIAPDRGMVQLVSDVLNHYPAIIKSFEQGDDSYPEQMSLWAATAHAYSKKHGEEFDYLAISDKQHHSDTKQEEADTGHQDPIVQDAVIQNTAVQDTATQDKLVHTQVNQVNQANQVNKNHQDGLDGSQALSAIHDINQQFSADTVNVQWSAMGDEQRIFNDIFVEEAREHLQIIKQFIDKHQHHDNQPIEITDELVRAFHTLRGASGSQALLEISDVSGVIEQTLAQLQQQEESLNSGHLSALKQSVKLIESYLTAYQQQAEQQANTANATDEYPQPHQSSDATVATEQTKLEPNKLEPNKLEQNKQDSAEVAKTVMTEKSSHEKHRDDVEALQDMLNDSKPATDDKPALQVHKLLAANIDELLDAEWELEQFLLSEDSQRAKEYAQMQLKHIDTLSKLTESSKKFQRILSVLASLYNSLAHKLSHQPDMAVQNDMIGDLLVCHRQLTDLFDALAGGMTQKVDEPVLAKIEQKLAQQNDDSDNDDIEDKKIDTNDKIKSDINQTNARTDNAPLHIETINTDPELLEIFLEEAQELDDSIVEIFATWRQSPEDLEALKSLQRHLHTIKGGARMAGISSIGDLTHEMETIYEAFVNHNKTPSPAWLTVMQSAQDMLSMLIDRVKTQGHSFFVPSVIEQLHQFAESEQLPDNTQLQLPQLDEEPAGTQKSAIDTQKTDTIATQTTADVNELLLGETTYQTLLEQSWTEQKPDPDILNVFLEEAEDLVESSGERLQAFRNNTSDVTILQELQRQLHTIKGGARMIGANGIADLAHNMETVYESLADRRRPATRMVLQLLALCHDWIAQAVVVLKHNLNPPKPTQYITALEKFYQQPDSLAEVPKQSLQSYLDAIAEYEQRIKDLYEVTHDISDMPASSGNFAQVTDTTMTANEMIRVSASLMERMINLSGESAINRARIDMGISSLSNSIEEMGTTVQRLADQLRRMDIELEEQILAQIDDETLMSNEGFDPLEMDQYSSLNQLSKSLSESASDLLDIKTTLLEKTRDAESLLLQLSRTQAELQDGLMNSRMLPFSRLSPRLNRIVRQTANELGKYVELTIIGADDEMDRTILERITSPLEHMLRNAVDHGIEPPQQRLAQGKDRTGHITLEVLREGGEVVIHLTDDGNGINVKRVKDKAIAQGLIDPNDTSLTDLDIMQYIFNAGLSTSSSVTQISGRGVGMDVVQSEIRQLSGTVSVDSEQGKGSRFTMRVPLTVAVSDALVVRVADRHYAVPLVQIERVVQVSPDELYQFYQSDEHTMTIGNQSYRLRYLNEILTGALINELAMSGHTTLPVLIVKNQTGQYLALQVDEIVGSRIEVVVKPLGKQLSHISGISAATIMGDGSVMLILDLMALIRNAPARSVLEQHNKPQSSVAKRILVVDDSVTVRKVTSRFLEREGFEAQVAKDGVDAIEILQDMTPDLILLDIEMPRMDGFEVATQIRHTDRLKDIPIIMITSRTGDKHRQRALDIGVNDYMGKPFQEAQLLQKLGQLLNVEVNLE